VTGRRAFLTLSLILGLSFNAGAQSLPLIVQVSPSANITVIASTIGATVIDSIPGANTYLLNTPAVPSAAVASALGIQWMELNTGVSLPNFAVFGIVSVPGTTASDWYKYQPAWQVIQAQQALPYSNGQGTVIADINSLVDYRHPVLADHLTSGYDFVASKPAGSAALDQSEAGFLDATGLLVNPAYSHGTLCAGVMAAIAPRSMIMPLRAFDDHGQSDLFTIAKAIRYAVQHGAHVINMSFGVTSASNSIQGAIQYAQQNNVLLVASAGNSNTSVPQYPAAYGGVMASAATDLLDKKDKKAAFSNYGSYIFVDAPGVNIISAYPGGYYSIVSGTSFSAPPRRRLLSFGLCEPVGLPIPYRRAPSTSIRRTPVTKTSLATAGLTCSMQSSRTRDRNNLESGPSPSGRGRRDSQRAPG